MSFTEFLLNIHKKKGKLLLSEMWGQGGTGEIWRSSLGKIDRTASIIEIDTSLLPLQEVKLGQPQLLYDQELHKKRQR